MPDFIPEPYVAPTQPSPSWWDKVVAMFGPPKHNYTPEGIDLNAVQAPMPTLVPNPPMGKVNPQTFENAPQPQTQPFGIGAGVMDFYNALKKSSPVNVERPQDLLSPLAPVAPFGGPPAAPISPEPNMWEGQALTPNPPMQSGPVENGPSSLNMWEGQQLQPNPTMPKVNSQFNNAPEPIPTVTPAPPPEVSPSVMLPPTDVPVAQPALQNEALTKLMEMLSKGQEARKVPKMGMLQRIGAGLQGFAPALMAFSKNPDAVKAALGQLGKESPIEERAQMEQARFRQNADTATRQDWENRMKILAEMAKMSNVDNRDANWQGLTREHYKATEAEAERAHKETAANRVTSLTETKANHLRISARAAHNTVVNGARANGGYVSPKLQPELDNAKQEWLQYKKELADLGQPTTEADQALAELSNMPSASGTSIKTSSGKGYKVEVEK